MSPDEFRSALGLFVDDTFGPNGETTFSLLPLPYFLLAFSPSRYGDIGQFTPFRWVRKATSQVTPHLLHVWFFLTMWEIFKAGFYKVTWAPLIPSVFADFAPGSWNPSRGLALAGCPRWTRRKSMCDPSLFGMSHHSSNSELLEVKSSKTCVYI